MLARRLLSHVNLLNIVLALLLVFAAQRTVMPFISVSPATVLPAAKKAAAPAPAEPAKPAEAKSPSPADYVVIAEQNLFHPERKIPVEKKEAQPLPKPEFVLYGTLRAGDVEVAYMEDRKQPVSTPTRGKKQIPLHTGQSLSGFILKEIDADKVVMQRGEEKIVVLLNDAHAPKTREGVGPAAPAGTAPRAAQPPAARRQAAQPPASAPAASAPPAAAQAPAPPALAPPSTAPAPARQQQPADSKLNAFRNLFKPKQ